MKTKSMYRKFCPSHFSNNKYIFDPHDDNFCSKNTCLTKLSYVQLSGDMSEVRQLITDVATGTPGVVGVVISDKDGVPVLKAAIESNNLLEGCFRHQFLSVFGTLSEHGQKMCLGPTSSIMATFDDYQVVHTYQDPLVLTIIASNEALTGQLMSLASALKPLVCDIAKTIVVM